MVRVCVCVCVSVSVAPPPPGRGVLLLAVHGGVPLLQQRVQLRLQPLVLPVSLRQTAQVGVVARRLLAVALAQRLVVAPRRRQLLRRGVVQLAEDVRRALAHHLEGGGGGRREHTRTPLRLMAVEQTLWFEDHRQVYC